MTAHLTFDQLKNLLTAYMPEDAVQKVESAFEFAKTAHRGQTRYSKEPYITHPVEVAGILAKLEQDTATICAGLLHDTLEDCDITREEIAEHFGNDVLYLVEGVTKLGKLTFESREEEQAENFRKMFLAMAKDIRVVIIKLADRLHNMRTLKFLPPHKRERIALETREIFAPLAHRLGMWTLKWELEDLAFYHLEYDEFQKIKKLVASRREEREKYITNFLESIRHLMEKMEIKARVTGRPKHFYSIYKKLESQDLSFDELYDTLGVRIIVNTIKECYEALGIIHSAYKPVNGRFKDYIAMPKSNMYQSLHTTVIGPEGHPIEVQIRTKAMHEVAEFGVAAHWRYKEGEIRTHYDADFAWLRQIVEEQQEMTSAGEFLQEIKVDLFIDEVFVFTPKGEVQALPKGATPVDFAYKIHTEIGDRCVGAKVNGQIVPLHYRLQSGDRVEILTSNTPSPKLDWLNFVQTSHARSKIKQWIRKQNLTNTVAAGKTKIEKLLLVAGHIPKFILTEEVLPEIQKRFKVQRFDDLYLQVAQGDTSARTVANFLTSLREEQEQGAEQPLVKPGLSKFDASSVGVRVLGESNIKIKLARCCNPLPGDDIVGFITINSGVSIHRADCPQVLNLAENQSHRLVEAEWENIGKSKHYPASIIVEAFDRIGILQEIVNHITETKTNIVEIQSKTVTKGGLMKAQIIVDLHNKEHLDKLKRNIQRIPDVITVQRGEQK